ncbi:MAG: penicillin-binding protein activator [Deltaproteobacteria bacterium]|nr:penicillin-binding protein activator [Deltaproteobacteria bacterium]
MALFCIFVGLFIVSGCAKIIPFKKKIPTEPLTPEIIQAHKMLGAAEYFIQAGEYKKALNIYNDYLSQSPPGPLADRFLMEKGNAYMRMEDYTGARGAYQILIFDFPRSLLADEAKFNIAFAYYKENNYEEAILYAKSLLSLKPLSLQEEIRLITLIGDSLLGQKKGYAAVVSYMDAYRLARGEAKEDAWGKIKLAIAELTAPEIRILSQRYKKDGLPGYLVFQKAKLYEQQGREVNALEVLSEFLRDFSGHELAGTAKELEGRLKKKLDIDKWAVGCILPLTGPYKQFGNRVLSGIELALAEFSSSTGAPPVRLIIKDSKSDPETATRALEHLVNRERVIGIIGPMVTAEHVAETANNMGLPIITLTQKEDITKIGNFIFRDFLTPLQQIKTIVPYAVNILGYKKFAIIYPEDTYGKRFMNLFWDELIQHGGQVVGIESYKSKETDFATPIKKLAGLYYERVEPIEADEVIEENGADETDDIGDEEAEAAEPEGPEPIIDFDAIFMPDTSKSISLIAPQLLYNDVSDVLLLGTNLWYSPWLLRQSAGYVQGSVFPSGFFVEDSSPVVREFVKNFQDTFGRKPTFLSAQGYDTAKLLFHLIKNPTLRTRNALRVALHQVSDFPTVTGFISFDETGDANKELALLKVQGKRFIQIR